MMTGIEQIATHYLFDSEVPLPGLAFGTLGCVGCAKFTGIASAVSGKMCRRVPLSCPRGCRTGHLYVLIEGRLEVIKGDTVVPSMTEPGAMLGEMSVLLDQPHTATVRAASDSSSTRSTMPRRFAADQPRPWRC